MASRKTVDVVAKVEAMRLKHPKASLAELMKLAKVNSSTYYAHLKRGVKVDQSTVKAVRDEILKDKAKTASMREAVIGAASAVHEIGDKVLIFVCDAKAASIMLRSALG